MTNRFLVAWMAAVVMLVGSAAQAQQQGPLPTESSFSFAVYGDSRSMMYLPYKSEQEAEARRADG